MTTTLDQIRRPIEGYIEEFNAFVRKNFSEELTARRMLAADHLIKDGRLSLAEVAETVGYQTYSGFWKAYKKFKEAEKI